MAGRVVVVAENYLPAKRSELALIAGHKIAVSEEAQQGEWLQGMDLATKAQGWFPAKYVTTSTGTPFSRPIL